MKDKVVLWRCQICGNEWKGESPQVRTTRPYCSECGSWNVRVKDWLIDKEKWNKARLNAFKRAGWRCEACGVDIHLSAPVHHLDYDDYYDSDSVVCLCSRCHHLNHGKTFSYKVGTIFNGIGIVGIIIGGYYVNDVRVSSWLSHRTLVMAIVGLFIGVVLIFLSRTLTKKTREVRRAIKKAVKNRTKIFEPDLENNERDDLDIDDEHECLCQGCGGKYQKESIGSLGVFVNGVEECLYNRDSPHHPDSQN